MEVTDKNMKEKPPENIFSSSLLRAFTMCPRYFYLRHEKGLTPVGGKPSPKTEFGTAFHLAAQLLDEGKELTEVILKATDYFRPFEPAPTISAAGNEIESLYTCVRLGTIIVEYVEKYKDNPIVVWEGLVEEGFAEEIDKGIFYCGRIDRVVKENKGIRPSDIKTTKALSSYIYNPHDQLQGYQWLGMKMFGSHITGVMFDMVGLGKEKRVYHREFVTYTDFQIQEWLDSKRREIEDIYRHRASGYWPKRSQKCNDFFTPCIFLPLCTAPNELGYERIMKVYDVDYWFSYEIKGIENKCEKTT